MSRFDYYDDDEALPWELWNAIVSNALGGRRGQKALAELEEALLALPEPRLIRDHLAANGGVCAVGAYVAHKRAQAHGEELATVINNMAGDVPCACMHERSDHDGAGPCHARVGDSECYCEQYEPEESEGVYETAAAGRGAGLLHTIAWHFAYLNDEQFHDASPEERYRTMLRWVRRAQGKPEEVAA